MKSLKIGYLTIKNPRDRSSWSGLLFYMHTALQQYAGEVEIVGAPRPLYIRIVWHIVRYVRLATGAHPDLSPSILLSWLYGKFFSRKVAAGNYDVIFAPIAASELAFFKATIPVFYLSDSTFKAQESYYYKAGEIGKLDSWQGNFLQRRTIAQSDVLLYASQWAADSALHDYDAVPEKLKIVPFGPNVDHPPEPDSLSLGSTDGKCRLLFVGVDWVRKGGPIAWETFLALRALGVDAELTIVGCTPALKHPNLLIIPFLSKKVPAELEKLERLYRDADFFLLPTRAECAGVVFAEASAFGLPSISTATGGVATMVENGINGFLLPYEADGEAYARTIASIWTDLDAYQKLRVTTHERFDVVTNWKAWASTIRELMLQQVAKSHEVGL